MSKIAQKSIDDILEAITVADYERITGERPRKAGANHFIKSPFTGEKSASFCIWSDGRFKDFSSGKSGNIITLMMEKNGMEFPDAVAELADAHGIIVERDGEDISPDERDELDKMHHCLELSMAAYQKKRSELAPDHKCIAHLVEKRELDQASIDGFEIGYAPADGKWLTQRLVDRGMAIPAEQMGLIAKNDGGQYYDRMRDAIVFPIRNGAGNLVGFGCRPFSGKPKYFNASNSPLFDKSRVMMGMNMAKRAIRLQNEAIITEGNFDVISMHRAGGENTVATCGTALTPHHCEWLKRHCKNIILMRDADAAGQKAAMRDFKLLLQHQFNVQICNLPKKQDPDDYVRTQMPPRKHFSEFKKTVTG